VKAFAYLRVSSKGQVDGDGFPRQRDVIARYAKQYEIDIHDTYAESMTGTAEAFDRPVLTALFEALKQWPDVKLVLVERADRLARDLMVSEILLAEFRKLGVKVVSAECGTDLTVDSNDPTKTLIRQILGALSQWEKSSLVIKLRAARARSGKKEGRKPFGYNVSEHAALTFIRDLQIKGHSLQFITDRLNGAGSPSRGGGKWHKTTVQRILKRETKI
jgi:DNA invertase Pin-like site-specific DNA recombinase